MKKNGESCGEVFHFRVIGIIKVLTETNSFKPIILKNKVSQIIYFFSKTFFYDIFKI
jgi:hypothetical protein